MAPLVVPFDQLLGEWGKSSPLQARIYFSIVGALAMLVATAAALRIFDRQPFSSIGLGASGFIRQALPGLALGVLWLAVVVVGLWLADCLTASHEGAVSIPLLLGGALDVFLNVLTQQLLLCGYLFQLLRRVSTTRTAIGISALLFVAYHAGALADGGLPLLNLFLTGMLFCLCAVIANGLWFPIFLHFGWNFMLGPVLGLTVSASDDLGSGWRLLRLSGPDILTGGTFGLEGGIVTTLATAILIVAIVRYGRRSKTSSPWPPSGPARAGGEPGARPLR
jgi:membrane protease YdiL (CAAX protease family)